MEGPSREEFKKFPVECLKEGEGVATPDRPLHAYQVLSHPTKPEPLELVEEHEEIEVIEEASWYSMK